MDNIWNKIPLGDYEQHMQHETVGQLQLLNKLTKKYLEKIKPETVLFLGISGGNGLEHIDRRITRQVVGVDINKEYLAVTKKRFINQLPNLKLANLDISETNKEITRANLIWAALIFEYVETGKCFEFIKNNILDNGHLIVTIQANNGVSSVSETRIESIKPIGEILRVVDQNDLLSEAAKFGFALIDFEENILPNKKYLNTYSFK